MESWGEKGLTPTQRLLRCFAELDTAKIKSSDRGQLLSSIQKDYGLTLEEAQMLIAEKEADVTMGKWGSMKYGSHQHQRKSGDKETGGGGGAASPSSSPSSPALSRDLLIDPISSELMVDPVILPCGHSFSHKTITQWLQKQKKCPSCNQEATIDQLKPNFALANVINHFTSEGAGGGLASSTSPSLSARVKERKKKKDKRKKQSTVEIKFYSKKTKEKAKEKDKAVPLLLYEGWGSSDDEEDSTSRIPISKSDHLDISHSHQRIKSSPELGSRRAGGGSAAPSPSRLKAPPVSRLVVRSKPIQLRKNEQDQESDGENMDSDSDGNGSEKEGECHYYEENTLPVGRDLVLALHSEFPQVNSEGRHSLLMVASVKAPIKKATPTKSDSSSEAKEAKEGTEEGRAPVAIVAVIDRSSSMRGEKMGLVKTALRFLVQQLSAEDYVGIVSYDGSVCTETKIIQLSGKGKTKVLGAIDSIDTGFMTNLSGGLFTGLKLFKKLPSNANLVTSLVLFTDGLANKGILNRRELIQKTEHKLHKLKARKGISPSLFTFGFGSAPDSQTLSQIAETSNGLYYAIESAEGIPVAFVDCLGGLLSVCAEEIVLELEAVNGVHIEKLYWRSGGNEESNTTRTSLDLGDIYFEEERDIVFSVMVPSVPSADKFEAVKAHLSYVNLPSRSIHRVTTSISIARPSVMHMSFESQQPNPVVDKQHNRIIAVEAIRKSVQKMNKGNYLKAEKVLQRGMERIRRSSTRTDGFCRSLVENLSECMRRTRTSKESKGKNNDTSYQNSLVVTHSRQRSTHTTTTYRTRNKSKAISTFKIDGHYTNSSDGRELRKSRSHVDSQSKKRPGHVSHNSDGKIQYNPLELVGEEKIKYVMTQSREAFEKIKLMYSLIEDQCTTSSCPKMCAGRKYEFLWKDERTGKILPLSAPGYMGQLFEWSVKEFERSEQEFGATNSTTQHMAAERAFMASIKNVMRRLFRVYAHIFYHHVSAFEKMGEMPLLKESFSLFISFVRRFALADEVDLLPMKSLIDTLNV